jgi:hypothetical protein
MLLGEKRKHDPLVPANASRSVVSRKAAFDGVNREHYF